jgi:UrcA family protein
MSFKKSSSARARGVLTAFGAVLALFAASGHAGADPMQKAVRYADLNLSNPQDASQLYARLERAAAVVCRTYEGFELSRKRMHEACEQEALSAAVAQVDDAALTALHNAGARVRVAQRRSASITGG